MTASTEAMYPGGYIPGMSGDDSPRAEKNEDGLWPSIWRILGVPLLIIYAAAILCYILGVATIWAIETVFGK